MTPQSVKDWYDFFVMAGAATAALAGLVFVGMSLHVRAISEHAEYRYRARVTLGALIFILVGTGLGLIPSQNGTELGVELMAATLVFLVFWSLNVRHLTSMAGRLPRAVVVRSGVGLLVVVAGAVGEVAMAAGAGWGLTLTALAFLTVLPLLVFNAWALLIGIVEIEPPAIVAAPEAEAEVAGV